MAGIIADIGVAVSLMREALTLLDGPEAMGAAQLLQMAIDAANEIGANGMSHSDQPGDEVRGGI